MYKYILFFLALFLVSCSDDESDDFSPEIISESPFETDIIPKVGGAVLESAVLENFLKHPSDFDGLVFKVSEPLNQKDVSFEVHGTHFVKGKGVTEIALLGTVKSSSDMNKSTLVETPSDFVFEHSSEFQLFNPGQVFITYFDRSQIEMLMTGNLDEHLFVSTYQVMSSNPLTADEVKLPNIHFEIQKFNSTNKNFKGANSTGGYGVPGSVRGNGCPRTWTHGGNGGGS